MSTAVVKLLTQKRKLLDRLEQNPGSNERAEIEQLLAKIDTALNLLDDACPDEATLNARGTAQAGRGCLSAR